MRIETSIAGVSFRGIYEQAMFRQLKEGQVLDLEREPENKYDPYAVKVMLTVSGERLHLGYVPKRHSETVFRALPDCEAAFIGGHLCVAWGQLLLEEQMTEAELDQMADEHSGSLDTDT